MTHRAQLLGLGWLAATLLAAAVIRPASAADTSADDTPADVLTSDQWQRVDVAVERGLRWLATQQQSDGSWPTLANGQPGVTSLCVMAFVAHGHVPGEGPYGRQLERAIDYVMSCQKQHGLLALTVPDGPEINRRVSNQIGNCAAYDHAISSLMLSELYGMAPPKQARRMRSAIDKSLAASLKMQHWPKDSPEDRGGWRYLHDRERIDSDLSITGWELMFLRSARNAGFDVPKDRIDEAVEFVRRSFDDREGRFVYSRRSNARSRAMPGAGVLALAHAGFHHSEEAQRSGEWILRNTFERYNWRSPAASNRNDRYHYGLFNCCQAAYQLGGKYWEEFFPPTVETLLANQRSDGSWEAENMQFDRPFGQSYTTALVLISLGAPNQLLPIFQR